MNGGRGVPGAAETAAVLRSRMDASGTANGVSGLRELKVAMCCHSRACVAAGDEELDCFLASWWRLVKAAALEAHARTPLREKLRHRAGGAYVAFTNVHELCNSFTSRRIAAMPVWRKNVDLPHHGQQTLVLAPRRVPVRACIMDVDLVWTALLSAEDTSDQESLLDPRSSVMNVPLPVHRLCASCAASVPISGGHRCGGCEIALYCNVECQRAHRSTHRAMCVDLSRDN
jgi:hypothetical protein